MSEKDSEQRTTPRSRRRAEAAGSGRNLSATKLRWGLLIGALGAVVAALVTMFITGFDNDKGLEAHQPGAEPVVRDRVFGSAAAGDCLTWSKADRSDLVKVNCADKHQFEVAAVVDLSQYPGREFGEGTRHPDSLRMTELKDEHCVPAVQQYLNGRLDPRGKYVVNVMSPSPDGWAHGDRTLRCGVQAASSAGVVATTGGIHGQDQSKVHDAGVCLGINQNLPTDPVDCSQQHSVEVVGQVDLAGQFTGGPPSEADQDRFVEQECTRISTDYLGSADAIRNKTLTLFFDYVEASSWLAGSHKLDCWIGKGADREGFAPIVGSARGEILINGQAPVPPPNSGRSTPAPLPGAAPLPPQPQPR
ncbi:septum formation family protein [Nocardia thailandica]|uniref:Septum formation family protein n=1 Tax=Nocardia thailandica TaxID=257275 RepID=A0ABW6PGQ8_9NOCA|nr:septum formation family protein [Nocardia thailandica]